jgi:hypothetical protein
VLRRAGGRCRLDVITQKSFLFRMYSRGSFQLEILAFRHQLRVLQPARPVRLRLSKRDRCLWVLLFLVWTGWRTSLVIVKPETCAPQKLDPTEISVICQRYVFY